MRRRRLARALTADMVRPRRSQKSGRLIGLQNQNRTWHIAKDMLRVRTKGQPRQPVVMMGRDNDQVDVSFLCHVDDFFTWHTFTKLAVAVCVLLPYIFGSRLKSFLEICPFPSHAIAIARSERVFDLVGGAPIDVEECQMSAQRPRQGQTERNRPMAFER